MNDDLVNNTSKILPIQHEKDSNDFFEWEHLKKGALLFNKVQLLKQEIKISLLGFCSNRKSMALRL